MLALGLLEHVFLAVPLPDALLWRWMIRAGGRELAVPAPPAPLCAKKA
jgi:hypothetical protein